MKNKISLLLTLAMALAVAAVFSVSAQGTTEAKSDKSAEAQAAKSNQGKNPNTAVTNDTIQTADTAVTQENEKKDKTKKNDGQVNAESHRSIVATFVQSLLDVADREGGIGEQVRVIARQQNEQKEQAADEIEAVESRNKIKTFLLGSDYKNLGALRSNMVQTRNQIEQLNRLIVKAENDEDKAQLQTQLQALGQEQAKIDDFITQNESKFSLFGWAIKLFSK